MSTVLPNGSLATWERLIDDVPCKIVRPWSEDDDLYAIVQATARRPGLARGQYYKVPWLLLKAR